MIYELWSGTSLNSGTVLIGFLDVALEFREVATITLSSANRAANHAFLLLTRDSKRLLVAFKRNLQTGSCQVV